MKSVLAILLSFAFFSLTGCSQKQDTPSEREAPAPISQGPDRPVIKAFPTATEVRLFVDAETTKSGQPKFTKSQGVLLTGDQRSKFEGALFVHDIAPDESFAACFIPHHFFRYYDKTGKELGEVSVCFCCFQLSASGDSNISINKGQDLRGDYAQLKNLVEELGERTDVKCDEE